MKLDKRIDDIRVKLMTCFNTDEAKEYLGQQGYFADEIHAYQDLDSTDFGTLDRVDNDDVPFKTGRLFYQFFLPAAYVRPAEKKWRPYTLMEFEDKFHMGLPIKFREKGKAGNERYLILNGYSHRQINGETITSIYIGAIPYTLDELFNEYEWQSHYTEDFEPFGVEE